MVLSPPLIVSVAKIGTALFLQGSYALGIGIAIFGQLTRVDTGEGLSDKRVEIYVTDPTGQNVSLFVMTMFQAIPGDSGFAEHGVYSLYLTEVNLGIPLIDGNWTIQTEFLGDDTYAGCDEKIPLLNSFPLIAPLPLLGAGVGLLWLSQML